ncbi:hypothetical protein V474_03340 [Novosphingobium barchaimii LL02]|uniref:CHK kinase-like domain-containing protein n=1 Tax=Novosphingobium barchaimii LL02 TaxID=1114963 RepID=A0A0J7XKP0_9SPHN|nr:phosphotransferase [Novosphingobium barchaimii]KMS51678.1 hypothetical protein V474_03340 [Novosphingobium barchaimii LL02]
MTFDPAPSTLDVVVSPEWLTAMLRQRWPDARVVAVEVKELLATQATKVRLALETSGGDETMPRAICIKGVLTDTGAMASSSLVETRFYRDGAEYLPVQTPACIHAGFSADAERGVIVMHDIKAAGGVFLSALSPVTLDEAMRSVAQLAALHAFSWNDPRADSFGWVPRFLDQIGSRPIMPTEKLQLLLDGPRGDALSHAIKDAGRLERAVAALARQGHEQPALLLHGDAHAGNIYRDAGGIGIVDWQIFQRGEWALDIAYHIAAIFSPEERRMHEGALLDFYRIRLAEMGGPEITAEAAWSRYRVALIYGYYLWSITQKVEPAITNLFVHRLGTAVDDLGSMELLEE